MENNRGCNHRGESERFGLIDWQKVFSTDVLGDLVAYPFRRRDWQYRLVPIVLLYTLLMWIFPPLAEVVQKGYAWQVAQRILCDGENPALPERFVWQNLLKNGWRWLLVSLVFNLPAILAFAVSLGVVLYRFGLPAFGEHFRAWPGLAQGWPLLLLGLVVALPLNILGGWLSNLAVMHMIQHDSLAAAFRFREWLPVLTADLRAFFQAMLALLGLNLALQIIQIGLSIPAAVLVVLPALIGGFFSFYRRLISVALYAGLYRQAIGLLNKD